jgi:two-component system, OmpR family, sensor kinase
VKRPRVIFGVMLLVTGGLALYLTPLIWQPEPVLVFQVGLGAGIFVLLLVLSALRLVAAAADQRGRQQAVDQVTRERDEAHQQFLRRLDHELKNPLTGLQAALTNLREAQSAAETQAAIDNAGQAAARLGRILRDLRKLAELEPQALERRPVDVGELVGEMVNAAGWLPANQGRSLNLLVSKVPSLPLVTGDCDLLGLAIFNLIDNALKFSGPDNAVEVRVREDGRALFIEVADSGAGISPHEHQRIFEDLYRCESARGIEGSGLGLALARRIVQLHGGDIALRSEPTQRRGAVFIIRLPV